MASKFRNPQQWFCGRPSQDRRLETVYYRSFTLESNMPKPKPVPLPPEPTVDRTIVTTALARLTSLIPSNPKRLETKGFVELLLDHLGLPVEDAIWLTGPAPRFRAPAIDAAGEKADKLRAALGSRPTGVMHGLGRFVYLEWSNTGDALPTTTEMAAQEVGVTASSVSVRLSVGRGKAYFTKTHPFTQVEDTACVSRMEVQPNDKAAALREAEARLAKVLAVRSKPRRSY